jgi:hypothetical protein
MECSVCTSTVYVWTIMWITVSTVEWNGEWSLCLRYLWNLMDNCRYEEWNGLYLYVHMCRNLGMDNCGYVELNGLCMVFICVESCG